ncbi:hypothetical protein B1207_04985 [Legionella quinlivanii]|uniref:Uncharacterized protein n=1 Tax=Legionella quinlivanii TaxID=45073 RepID=A0A364LLB3_9GAMM|nr:hypothetical protein [Legionella quinlivanii]RAP37530.1 hypothetical protein B1207_04985 [Legionella quinlivanii]
MGWMASVQNLGTTVQNWGKSLNNALTSLSNNSTLTTVAKGLGNSAHKVVSYGFKQMAVAPDLAYNLTNSSVRSVYKNMGYILGRDVAPLVAASFITKLAVEQLRALYTEDEEQLVSVNTGLTLLIGGLYVLGFLYRAKKNVETTTHMLMHISDASKKFSEAGSELNGASFRVMAPPAPGAAPIPMTICQQQKCGFMEKFKGSIENSITYWATRGLIWGISFIPYVGEMVSTVLLILYDGQFILAMAMPEHCNRHITAYLEENWELAASLGIGSRGVAFAFVEGIFYLTGIPREHYQDVMLKFAVLMQIATATHMNLPPPVDETSRYVVDPLLLFGRGVSFVDGLIMEGAKKKIPEMLKQQKSTFNWERAGEIVQSCWSHPYLQKVIPWVAPSMFVSKTSFTNDPLIKADWIAFRKGSPAVTKAIIKTSKNLAVWAASSEPDISAKALQKIKGMPPFVTKIAMASLYNPSIMELVYRAHFSFSAIPPGEERPQIHLNGNKLREIESSGKQDKKDETTLKEVAALPAPPTADLKSQEPADVKATQLKDSSIEVSAKALRSRGKFSATARTEDLRPLSSSDPRNAAERDNLKAVSFF